MEDTFNQNLIKTILGYIPLFAVIGYCFSTIQIYVYYSLFGINILPYLEFTEIIPHAATTIVIICIIPFVLFVLAGFAGMVFKESESKRKPMPTIKTKREKIIDIALWGGFVILPIITGLTMIFFDKGLIENYFDGILHLELAGYLITLLSLKTWFDYFKLKASEHKLLFYSIFTLLTLIASGLTNSTIEYEFTRYLGAKTGTSIIYNSKKIVSDKSYIYIGGTVKYVFFYNAIEKGVDIYPISSISQIMIREPHVVAHHSIPPF